MDEKIERPPLPLYFGKHLVNGADVLDVAGQNEVGADRPRERLHALGERVALIGEGELGAVRREGARNAPGDRMVVGDPHDQAALAVHQIGHCVRHPAA